MFNYLMARSTIRDKIFKQIGLTAVCDAKFAKWFNMMDIKSFACLFLNYSASLTSILVSPTRVAPLRPPIAAIVFFVASFPCGMRFASRASIAFLPFGMAGLGTEAAVFGQRRRQLKNLAAYFANQFDLKLTAFLAAISASPDFYSGKKYEVWFTASFANRHIAFIAGVCAALSMLTIPLTHALRTTKMINISAFISRWGIEAFATIITFHKRIPFLSSMFSSDPRTSERAMYPYRTQGMFEFFSTDRTDRSNSFPCISAGNRAIFGLMGGMMKECFAASLAIGSHHKSNPQTVYSTFSIPAIRR